MRVRCPQCSTINELPATPSELPSSANCFLCGKDFSTESDLVKDTGGRYYHRRCYEDASRYEQARRREETRRRLTAHAAGTPSDSANEDLAPISSDAEGFGELEPTVDDLWKGLFIPSGEASAGLTWKQPPASRRSHPWIYVMMGFAAAVPVVVLLFIMVQLVVNSFEPKPSRPPATKQTPVVTRPDDSGLLSQPATTWSTTAGSGPSPDSGDEKPGAL